MRVLTLDSRRPNLHCADARRTSEGGAEASGRNYREDRPVPATHARENARVEIHQGVYKRDLENASSCVGFYCSPSLFLTTDFL